MAVKIRLRRMGRRNRPFFRVVAADERTSPTGRFIENLGWYDPNRADPNFSIKLDRIDHWIGNGAKLSDTVNTLTRRARRDQANGTSPAEPVASPEAAEANASPEAATVEAESVEEAPAQEDPAPEAEEKTPSKEE